MILSAQGENQKRSKKRHKLDLTGSIGEGERFAEEKVLSTELGDTSSYNASNIHMKSVFNQNGQNL